MVKSLISSIPSDKQERRGWSVSVNGTPVNSVTEITIENPKFGLLKYGLTPGGYDGWSFHEVGGGGVVIVPYVRIDGVLHVGLVEQMRHNQGGRVLNLPRGFVDPNEPALLAASRELLEETEYEGKPFVLEGEAMNANSAFFETTEEGEGVKFFAIEVPPEALERINDRWAFKKDALIPATDESNMRKTAELILGVRFLPAKEAMKLADMFTVAGVGRLLAQQSTDSSRD